MNESPSLYEARLLPTVQTGAALKNEWVYLDEADLEAFRVLEYENGDTRRKLTRMIWPVSPSEDAWRMDEPPGPWPLYRLPELPHFGRVYVCQSESAADALWWVGLAATTSARGCYAAHKSDWAPLATRDVVILPKNDRKGRVFARAVAAELDRVVPSPCDVRVLELPGLSVHGDVLDFLNARLSQNPESTAAEIGALADRAPDWKAHVAEKSPSHHASPFGAGSARAGAESQSPPHAPQSKSGVIGAPLESEAPEREWLWPGHFATGELGLLVEFGKFDRVDGADKFDGFGELTASELAAAEPVKSSASRAAKAGATAAGLNGIDGLTAGNLAAPGLNELIAAALDGIDGFDQFSAGKLNAGDLAGAGLDGFDKLTAGDLVAAGLGELFAGGLDGLDPLAAGKPIAAKPDAAKVAADKIGGSKRTKGRRSACRQGLIGLDLAARVSTGAPWPDGSGQAQRGSVVLVNCMGEAAERICRRLDRAGADKSRIVALGAARRTTPGRMQLTAMAALERAIRQLGDVRLVLIDPADQYLTGSFPAALKRLAAEYGLAVLMVSSLDRRVGGLSRLCALQRRALQHVRTAWVAVPDSLDPGLRLFLPATDHGGTAGLAYRVAKGRLHWESAPAGMRTDEALRALRERPGPPPARLLAAAQWLRCRLELGPAYVGHLCKAEAGTLRHEIKEAGLAWGTMLRAFRLIGAVSERCPITGKHRWRAGLK